MIRVSYSSDVTAPSPRSRSVTSPINGIQAPEKNISPWNTSFTCLKPVFITFFCSTKEPLLKGDIHFKRSEDTMSYDLSGFAFLTEREMEQGRAVVVSWRLQGITAIWPSWTRFADFVLSGMLHFSIPMHSSQWSDRRSYSCSRAAWTCICKLLRLGFGCWSKRLFEKNMASWHLRLSLGQVRALGAHGARGALGTRVYLRIDGARHSEGWAQSETAVFHNFEEKLCHSHCIVCTMACYFVMGKTHGPTRGGRMRGERRRRQSKQADEHVEVEPTIADVNQRAAIFESRREDRPA